MKKVIIIGLTFILSAVITYTFFLDQNKKDLVNVISTASGVEKAIPWEERALTISEVTINNSKSVISESIIGVTHPSAKNANLEDFEASKNGTIIRVVFEISFEGGMTGKKYTQIGSWRFSEQQDFGYSILSDNAPFGVKQNNLDAINAYFKKEVYPVILGNMN